MNLSEASAEQRARFWANVDMSAECWRWMRCLGRDGYGRAHLDRRQYLAHRLAYTFAVGDIPVGLELDHLCRNKWCVNPAHLEPVTHAENVRRGTSPATTRDRHAARTHCKRGHGFAENSYLYKGVRICRTCQRTARQRREAA